MCFCLKISDLLATILAVPSFVLADVEECQLSECGGEEELGGGESPLPRSSSTSDITQQLSDTLPGKCKQKWILFFYVILWWSDSLHLSSELCLDETEL